MLEKTVESPVDYKKSKPVILKEIDPKFTGRADAEGEAPILWPPDVNRQLIGEDPNAGKDWRPKEEGAAEDEMVREHHLLNGHESEQSPGESEESRSLVRCSPQDHKEPDTT